jgi:hypothetical protein
MSQSETRVQIEVAGVLIEALGGQMQVDLILWERSLLGVAPTLLVLIGYGTISALAGGWLLRPARLE